MATIGAVLLTTSAVATSAVATSAAVATAAATPPLALNLIDAAVATSQGAVCLDGSPPGYYYRKASSAAASDKWVLYMGGGAWCSSPTSCASRSLGHLGSSTKFAKTLSYPQGVLDGNVSTNPTFGHWNHVFLAYCDGGSFSGDATSPIVAPHPSEPHRNVTLFLRGRRVLQILISTLAAHHGLGSASEVMLSGGSAGGLAVLLQADYVRTLLPVALPKFRAVPVSGFFLLHQTLKGADAFEASMRATYTLHNASTPEACVAHVPPGESWRCFFANYSYASTRMPTFLIQSSVDLYQLFAILQAGGWDAGCLNRGTQFANCTLAQIESFNAYAAALLSDWGVHRTTGKASRRGEGAFVESCLEHVAEQTSAMFNGYAIGGVSMQQALSKWWLADGTQPAAAHTHMPCELSLTRPHQCNPTCFAHGGVHRVQLQADADADARGMVEHHLPDDLFTSEVRTQV